MCQKADGANSQKQGSANTAEKWTHQPHHSPIQWVKSSLLLISYILSVLLNTLCIIFAVGEEHSQSLFLQFI